MKDESKVLLTQTRLALLATGSPKISSQFVKSLDEELVSRGQQPVKLDINRLQFEEPVIVLSPDENFVGTQPPMTVTIGGNSTTPKPFVVVNINKGKQDEDGVEKKADSA